MDEPFAALDEITRFRLNNDLLRLQGDFGCTVVFVTHSVYESVYLSIAHRGHGGAARTGRRGDRRRRAGYPRNERFRAIAAYADLVPHATSEALHGAMRRTSTCERRAWPHDRPEARRAGTAPLDRRTASLKIVAAAARCFVARRSGPGNLLVRYEVPPYILPAPSAIGATLVKDWPMLWPRRCSSL